MRILFKWLFLIIFILIIVLSLIFQIDYEVYIRSAVPQKFIFLENKKRKKYVPVIIYKIGFFYGNSNIYMQSAQSLLSENGFEQYPSKDGYIIYSYFSVDQAKKMRDFPFRYRKKSD